MKGTCNNKTTNDAVKRKLYKGQQRVARVGEKKRRKKRVI